MKFLYNPRWNLSILKRIALLLVMQTALLAAEKISWRIIESKYPSLDVIVAGCTVQDYGARGDGKTDDTEAFQRAMKAMAAAGGGTVFVPEGFYAVRGNLTVPTSVTLRGEWQKPEKGPGVKGTVLQAYQGRGLEKGTAFISLSLSSGVRNLSIWYPEQKAGRVTPYPFCIRQIGGDNATVENITLVNPYQGIIIGPEWNELHYVHNVYGSPLKTGLQFDFTTDIGRLENIDFNPDVWSLSGLPGAPKKHDRHAAFMRKKGTGMRMYRSDWEYGAFISIRGYKTGFEILPSERGTPNAQFYGLKITDCDDALYVTDANAFGVAFTDCVLSGDETGISVSESMSSVLLFMRCRINGGEKAAALPGKGSSMVMFQRCDITGQVDRESGNISLVSCKLSSDSEHIRLGSEVNAASIAGCSFAQQKKIENLSGSENIKITDEKVDLKPFPAVSPIREVKREPARSQLYLVTASPWGARRDGKTDDTKAVQAALDAAARDGGGIVFFPGGEYVIKGNLVVKEGVEMRGVFDVPHHTLGKGSSLFIYAGRGSDKGKPFITLQKNCGIRGMTFAYPEQECDAIRPYPPMIQGQGPDLYVINSTAMNPYNMIDLASYRCDRHHLNYLGGSPLKTAISVGKGAAQGEVINVQFNPHYWGRTPYPGTFKEKGFDPLWTYQKENLAAFVFGHCRDELQFQNFVFGSLYGIRFVREKGGSASSLVLGHGTDGSKVSAAFEGVGPDGIDLINSELVCMASRDKKYIYCAKELEGEVRFYNTMLWGGPDKAGVIDGGSLVMELANFEKYAEGFEVNGGSLTLINNYIASSTGKQEISVNHPGSRVELTANTSPRGLRLNREGMKSLKKNLVNTQRQQALAAATKSISVTLLERQKRYGLALREKCVETEPVPVKAGRRWGWTAVNKDGKNFMYWTVEFREFSSGNAEKVRITVEYLDRGQGNLRLVYDSSDENVKVVSHNPGAWKEAGSIELKGSGKWLTYETVVKDALFSRRCNGADLRFEIEAAKNPVIGSVTLTRLD